MVGPGSKDSFLLINGTKRETGILTITTRLTIITKAMPIRQKFWVLVVYLAFRRGSHTLLRSEDFQVLET